jgi:hypothetical protein
MDDGIMELQLNTVDSVESIADESLSSKSVSPSSSGNDFSETNVQVA